MSYDYVNGSGTGYDYTQDPYLCEMLPEFDKDIIPEAPSIIAQTGQAIAKTGQAVKCMMAEPITFKDYKLAAKICNTIFKLSGHLELAAASNVVKHYFRYEGNNQFLVNGKLKIPTVEEIIENLKTNKGQREIVRQLLALTTEAEKFACTAALTGVISYETMLTISTINQTLKYLRHAGAVVHAGILGKKALDKPDNEKAGVWKFTAAKGLVKGISLTAKVFDLFPTGRKVLAVKSGLMGVVKKKGWDPIKRQRKEAQKAEKKAKAMEKQKASSDDVQAIVAPKAKETKVKKVEQSYMRQALTALSVTSIASSVYLKFFR